MARKHMLILTRKPFAPPVRDRMVEEMTEAGIDVSVMEGEAAEKDITTLLQTIDGLIVRSDPITAEMMEACPNLRLVIRGGAGYDNIDVAYAEAHGIVVENTPGQNANAVAELAVELMLAALRPLNGKAGAELRGRKVGVHGFGNIGRIVTRLCRSFGMHVRVHDMRINPDAAREFGAEIAESEENLYEGADIISLHLPENPATRGLVNYKLMSTMSDDGVLVNTARAGVVEEADLLRVMADRPDFVYATDVAPGAETAAILSRDFADRYVVTPKKQGAQTLEANLKTGLAAARQAAAFFAHGDTTFCVYKIIPPELKDYAQLAVQLGRLNAAYVPAPRQVQFTGYGELNEIRSVLGDHVLKGVLSKSLGADATPGAAAAYAAEHGLEIIEREPDNSKGYGNAVTVDLIAEDGTSFSSRGRIDEGQMEASRIGEFKARMPLDPGIYVLATYKEGPGMADRVGRFLIDAGFNRVVIGAGPNIDHTKAQAFYQVEKASLPVERQFEEVRNIAERMRAVADVHDVKVVNLWG